MHLIVGLLILTGIGAFVVFTFWQSMSIPRSGREEDYGSRIGSGGGDHSADGGFGHGS